MWGDGSQSKAARHQLLDESLEIVIDLLLLSIAFAIATILKAKLMRKSSASRAWKLTAFQRVDFTCEDVLECSKEENIIGRGGAGIVYKGSTSQGKEFAVKRLPGIGRGSSNDHGFVAEIQTLGRIRHRHIVRLLGFCSNNEINLLVYEYMPHESLGELLHGKKGGHLQWETRYKIALEAAICIMIVIHLSYTEMSNPITVSWIRTLKLMSQISALPSSCKIKSLGMHVIHSRFIRLHCTRKMQIMIMVIRRHIWCGETMMILTSNFGHGHALSLVGL